MRKPGKRANLLTALIPGAELAFAKTDKPTVPTLGRTLNHIGFDVKEHGRDGEAARSRRPGPL